MDDHQACPKCGAANAIPMSGLTMTCEYCGFERPVPDATARKNAMEAAERDRRRAEERARKEAKREKAAARKERREKRHSAVGWIRGGLYSLLPFAIMGAVTYWAGLWDPLIGDTGKGELAKAIAEVEAYGYETLGEPQSERVFTNPESIYVDMESSGCYAIAIGTGKRLRRVELGNGKVVHTTNLHRDIIYHCARKTTSVEITVTLEERGRFTWVVMAPPEATGDGDVARFPDGCKVRAKASSKSKKIGYAEPAVPYRIIERKGKQWRLIELGDGERGWTTCPAK